MARGKKPSVPSQPEAKLPEKFDVSKLRQRRDNYSRSASFAPWDEGGIKLARAAQVIGQFQLPWRFARSLRADAAVFKALVNRAAPHRGLPRAFTTRKSTGLEGRIRAEAEQTFNPKTSGFLGFPVLGDLIECRTLHGIAIGCNLLTTRTDGSRVDFAHHMWPLDAVRYDSFRRQLVAMTTDGEEDIVHGDGRWVVYTDHSLEPWAHGALVALAGVWLDRQGAVHDRAANAESHGEDKWIGTMPEGVGTEDAAGDAMVGEMVALHERRRVALIPFGSQLKREEAMGQNWQIFDRMITSDNADVNGILLGHDYSATGGNYVKDSFLFGIRTDIIEGDLRCLESGLAQGFFRPWSIINFGFYDDLAMGWLMPDADEDARREALSKRHAEFTTAVKAYRDGGFVVDQKFADDLARELGIVVPRLAEVGGATSSPTS